MEMEMVIGTSVARCVRPTSCIEVELGFYVADEMWSLLRKWATERNQLKCGLDY